MRRPSWDAELATICHRSTTFFQTTVTTTFPLTLKLPEGYTFADLKLRRCEFDAIDLEMDLVRLVCKVNGLDFDKVLQNPGPVVTTILTVWYKNHLNSGGDAHAVMQDLIAPARHLN